MKRLSFSRRMMLRGAFGTVIGLPLFEFMLNPSGEAYAHDGSTLPHRYFAMQCPTALVTSGSRVEAMTPTRAGFGYPITPVLQPLSDRAVASDVSVISGLFVAPLNVPGGYDVDYHGQATYAIMTGRRSGFTGVHWRPPALSVDQLIASAIGGRTRLPFLYYQLDRQSGGTRLCYEKTVGLSGEPPVVYQEMTPQISPSAAYRSLMMERPPSMSTPDPGAELDRRLRLSSLSYAGDQISSFQKRLGAADRQTLDQHLTHLRALEKRLLNVAPPVGMTCSDPKHRGTDPADLAPEVPDQEARASLFADLIAVAFACDITRTITFGGAAVLTGSGMRHQLWNSIGGLHGEVQHASSQSNLDTANRFFVDVYARVIQRLKATAEGAGNLLDHTAAVFVMEGGKGLTRDPQRSGDGGGDSNHSVDNALMMLAGRAGGLRPGQHLNLTGRDLHPAAVFNTAMRAIGVAGTLGEIPDFVEQLF